MFGWTVDNHVWTSKGILFKHWFWACMVAALWYACASWVGSLKKIRLAVGPSVKRPLSNLKTWFQNCMAFHTPKDITCQKLCVLFFFLQLMIFQNPHPHPYPPVVLQHLKVSLLSEWESFYSNYWWCHFQQRVVVDPIILRSPAVGTAGIVVQPRHVRLRFVSTN